MPTPAFGPTLRCPTGMVMRADWIGRGAAVLGKDGVVEVEWWPYLPGRKSGRGLSHVTSSEEFQVVLTDLQRSGGYVEVCVADSRYPLLTLSVSGDYGIVHSFFGEDDCRLLQGDGSVPPGDAIEFSILEEDALFSAGFISSRTRACDVLSAFVEGIAPAALGEWERL
jgi:hypothetical protein